MWATRPSAAAARRLRAVLASTSGVGGGMVTTFSQFSPVAHLVPLSSTLCPPTTVVTSTAEPKQTPRYFTALIHSVPTTSKPHQPSPSAPPAWVTRRALQAVAQSVPLSVLTSGDLPILGMRSSRSGRWQQQQQQRTFVAINRNVVRGTTKADDEDMEKRAKLVEDEKMRALRPVQIAIMCNTTIFVGKLGMYLVGGSSAMLAESVHSFADCLNQYLLRVGILGSLRSPDAKHNYGYSRERFVWALISAVGIFCVGAGVNIMHGIHNIVHPQPVEHILESLGVLAASAVAEGYTLMVAYKHLKEGADQNNMTVWQMISTGRDPTTTAVLAEDGAAVAGLGIAAACLAASHITGAGIYDAGGSVLIGCLLGATALHLIQVNRDGLLGKAMNPVVTQQIMSRLKEDDIVHNVFDVKTEEIGPGEYRFKAEIDFKGDMVVKNYLDRCGREELYGAIRAATLSPNDKALDIVMMKYGEEIVETLGDEVDRLEKEIMAIEPRISHVDIETN